MIKIIDYGLGNIRAFVNVFERIKQKVERATKPEDLTNCSKIILPGVGSFDYAMTLLNKSGLRNVLEEKVLVQKIPVLGVCVGMQMLASSSEEGVLPGLGWIEGEVKLFNTEHLRFKTRLPHMGWNTISPNLSLDIMKDLDDRSRFYFLHSYYFQVNDQNSIGSTTEYGFTFPSTVYNKHIFGVQFHPEKSHQNGVRLLENFAKL
jgi:imidazole glycerol-phosphate synthase subunit HisH